MPKKQPSTPIAETEKELYALQVKKFIEQTTIYDSQIEELKTILNTFNFGMK